MDEQYVDMGSDEDHAEAKRIHEMRIMDSSGDTKTIWDPKNKDEVKAAKELFEKLIGKGFSAFRVDKKGEKAERVKEFDPEIGALIMVPRIAGG